MPAADLVLVNAAVRTMDPLVPVAGALAVRAGRIVALGDADRMRDLAGPATRVIDAGGRLVLPGFQDSHLHLQDSGTGRALSADLEDARTVDDLGRMLAAFGRQNPNAAWVNGVGWYSGVFGEHNLSAAVLDAAVADRPVFIYASDGHNACVNTAGLAALGITAETPDPPNGAFVRAADGTPTGLIYEDAIEWVRERMPRLTDDDYATGVRYGQRHANAHGITGVLDALVDERHMRVYGKLEEAGELTVRIRATIKIHPDEAVPVALARAEHLRARYRSDWLSAFSAKFFFDGVFENRTAALIAPTADRGDNAPLMFSVEQIAEWFPAFDARRFQLHVHAIGDLATRAALDGFERARRLNGAWPSLHQIAHVQLIDPADIPRFRALGAVANLQTLWARHEASIDDVALPMAGPERGRWMYAFRSLIEAGALHTVSSDWGVSTLNPFPIMHTAVTRQPEGRPDHPVFIPEERITVEDVVRGYTVNAARALWREDDTGSLAVGKSADLIVLDRDVFAVDPHELPETEVLLTLLEGREVHRAPRFDG